MRAVHVWYYECMIKFLLFQPFVLFVVFVGVSWVRLSAWVGASALVAGIVAAIGVAYWLRSRRLKKLTSYVGKLNIQAQTIVPIKDGVLGIDALVLTQNGLQRVSPSTRKWQIDYDDVSRVSVDVYTMTYKLTSKDEQTYEFAIHPLKSREEIFKGVIDPKMAAGALSVVGAPVLAASHATAMSAGSARQRTEAMNVLLAAVLPKETPIDMSYDGSFKTSDIILGVALGLEIVALVILAVLLTQ